MIKKAILFCFLTFYMLSAIGQNKVSDSLMQQVQKLIDQAWDFTLASKDSALVLSNQALQISEEQNYYLGQVLSKEAIGLYHEIVTGDIEKASSQYFEAIDLCEAHDLDYLGSVFQSLGIMFHTTDNYQKGKEYYLKSMEIARQQNDTLLLKKCLSNLGSVSSSLEDFQQAEVYMKQCLELPGRPDINYSVYANLGYLYVKQERFAEAIPVLVKSSEQNPDNPGADLNLYFLLHAKTKAKDSTGMTQPLLRAKKAADSGDYGLRDKSLLYRNIADYLAFTGNYKEALAYRDKYVTVFEEIKEKQRDAVVLEMESRYKSEKKDAQMQLLTLENDKTKQQRFWYLMLALAGLLMAGLIGVFLLKNKRQNSLLATQKALLEKTVDEKNLLLRETHHRVKNSFQMVSSLLYIQSETAGNREAKIAIADAQNRVRSMVLIHQKLYNNDRLVGINTKEYIEDFTKDVVDNYQFESTPLKYTVNAESMVLDVETITPIGLILNELITNVLKHAFNPVDKHSLLEVSFLKADHDCLELKVCDNGQGLVKTGRSDSFGIQLISALAEKLDADFSLEDRSENGACALLIIKKYDQM